MTILAQLHHVPGIILDLLADGLGLVHDPMQLRQWIVTDPAGIETTVPLFNTEEGVTLDPELFKFERIWPNQRG